MRIKLVVVGHIICNEATVKTSSTPLHVFNFGPISVLTQYQRQSVGSALINDMISFNTYYEHNMKSDKFIFTFHLKILLIYYNIICKYALTYDTVFLVIKIALGMLNQYLRLKISLTYMKLLLACAHRSKFT